MMQILLATQRQKLGQAVLDSGNRAVMDKAFRYSVASHYWYGSERCFKRFGRTLLEIPLEWFNL